MDDIFSLRNSTPHFAHAVFLTLRARAAPNDNGEVGLETDLRRAVLQ